MKIYKFIFILLVTSIVTNISSGECGAKESKNKDDVEYCEEYDDKGEECLEQDKCSWTPDKMTCESKHADKKEDQEFCEEYDEDEDKCVEESDRCRWQIK